MSPSKKLLTNIKFLIILQITGLIIWSVGMYLIIGCEAMKGLDGNEDVALLLTIAGVPSIGLMLSIFSFMGWIIDKNFKYRLLVGSVSVILIILGVILIPTKDEHVLLGAVPLMFFIVCSLIPKEALNGSSSSSGGGGCGGRGGCGGCGGGG